MVVVSVGVAGIVLGQAHGGTENVNREGHNEKNSVRLEPIRSNGLVGEKEGEGGGQAKSYQIGEAVKLSSEFGTCIYEARGKPV